MEGFVGKSNLLFLQEVLGFASSPAKEALLSLSLSLSFHPGIRNNAPRFPGQEAECGSIEQGRRAEGWGQAGNSPACLHGWFQEPLSGHTWELPPSVAPRGA